jgi:hypothetical protein
VEQQKKKWEGYILLKKEEKSSPHGSRIDILEDTIGKLEKEFGAGVDSRTLNRWLRDIKEVFNDKEEVDLIFKEMKELFSKV